MSTYASIALFVYKRLRHTRLAVESLLANKECGGSNLIVFCDAAKKPEDRSVVEEVRAFARSISGFRSTRVVERESNFGLAKSIITGVSEILESEERVIVLEDDLYLSPYFLKYMNDALALYASNERVASIHGYVYPLDLELPGTFFVRGADCWGWGTWKRAWKKFNPDGQYLLDELMKRNLARQFDYNGHAGNLKMLRKQIAGKNDSWAIRWHASAFLEDMYTLYPGKSLVRNTGMDGQGTHSESTDKFETDVTKQPISLELLPVAENPEIVSAIKRFYKKSKPSILDTLLKRLL